MALSVIKTERTRIGELDLDNLGFGELFSDHMFSVIYQDGQWQPGIIMPFGKIEIFPSMCSLHYGQAVFEGMKAFYTQDGSINIFRPSKHHARWNNSCRRLCIPEIDDATFLGALDELVRLDENWVPRRKGYSLYLRPFVFATDDYIGLRVSESYRFMIIAAPVGAYYKEGINPVRLVTETEYVRASRGGLGATKTPANYAASLFPTEAAHHKGFSQVIWLDGIERKYVEEVGSMNLFFVFGDELVTPALGGTILAGVTRDSVLELAKAWGIKTSERLVPIDEVIAGAKDGTLKEVFGSGTAAVISPVSEIQHEGELVRVADGQMGPIARAMYDEITGIQYGERQDRFAWCHKVP